VRKVRDVERQRTGTRRVPVVVSVTIPLLLAACGGARTPELPLGLDAIDQSSDEASIKQILTAMPDAVAGKQRAASYDPLSVEYGEGSSLRVRVMRLGEAAAAEGFPATAVGFLQRLVDGGEVEVEERALDPSSDLAYVVSITTESFAQGGSRHETKRYAVAWGEPDSEWMFTAVADTPENRIALVEAFVGAARSIG